MDKDFQDHVRTWESLGRDDPLWAVFTRPDKRGGQWDLAEFLATGVQEVARYRAVLAKLKDAPDRFGHVLDFGCGVGRLTLAWAPYAQAVTGVDVSAPMVVRAQELARATPSVQFVHNPRTDLSLLSADRFDLVFSNQCLQHIAWGFTETYLREFARVCRPGGLVVFQLPARPFVSQATHLAGLRKAVIDHLPFNLGNTYRRWRRGTDVVFEMHYTPVSTVIAVLKQAGLRELHLESDSYDGAYEGFIYVFRKP